MTSLEAAYKNYDENLKNIPWNKPTAQNFQASNTAHNGTINSNLPIYVNLVEQQARNVSGAAGRRNDARSKTDLGINKLKEIPNAIDMRIAKIDIGGIQNKIRVVEEQIEKEKGKQQKANELLEIRKEQSQALVKKYSANLHSSWLGLWRPLKEDTHVGLNVASAMFGLLAILAIGYLVYKFIVTPATSQGGAAAAVALRNNANNVLSTFSGGFRKLKN
jgi:hypothetical protein